MNWYYKVLGSHTHVRVFMNGGKCGDLVFRNEEFEVIKQLHLSAYPNSMINKLINESE